MEASASTSNVPLHQYLITRRTTHPRYSSPSSNSSVWSSRASVAMCLVDISLGHITCPDHHQHESMPSNEKVGKEQHSQIQHLAIHNAKVCKTYAPLLILHIHPQATSMQAFTHRASSSLYSWQVHAGLLFVKQTWVAVIK